MNALSTTKMGFSSLQGKQVILLIDVPGFVDEEEGIIHSGATGTIVSGTIVSCHTPDKENSNYRLTVSFSSGAMCASIHAEVSGEDLTFPSLKLQ